MTADDRPDESLIIGVLRLLTELDPYFLEPGGPDGFPADEYGFEARPLADLLSQNGSITAAQVDAVWLEWFSESLTDVVGAERVRELVVALDGLVRDRPE